VKLIEAVALAAAEMKPVGLAPADYLELPPIILSAEDMPNFYLERPVRHVEVLAQCVGCSRPLICVGKVVDGHIHLHDMAEHLLPHEEDCMHAMPVRMAAFRQLVFRGTEALTN